MTNLDRRDRRRGLAILRQIPGYRTASADAVMGFIDRIAAALKREREETGLAAIGHLFAKRDQKNALKAFEAQHGKVKKR